MVNFYSSNVNCNNVFQAFQPPVNNAVSQGTVVIEIDQPQLEKEIETVVKSKWDLGFLTEALNLLRKYSNNKIELKRILKHPLFIERSNKLNIKIDDLVQVCASDQQVLQNPLIQKWFASQCVRAQVSLSLELFKPESNFLFGAMIVKERLLNLLLSHTLPRSIEEPLRVIASLYFKEACAQIPEIFNNHSLNLEKISSYSIYTNSPLANFSVKVGNEIDGYEQRENGIRLRIHQPREGKEKALDLVIKILQEFQSGRRRFVFSPVDQVPYQNYKEVMLYVLQCLKEDRARYYAEHPDFLNEKTYEQTATKFESKGISKIHDEDKDIFEWVARKLVAMEANVLAAQSDYEIKTCLQKFYEVYRDLPNYNMDLTVSSCIDPRVFLSGANYKPVLHTGVPSNLIKLAEDIGISGNFSMDKALQDLTELSKVSYHPDHVSEILDQLKEVYEKIVQDPQNKELIRQFLSIFSTIPQKDVLLTQPHDYRHGEKKVSPLGQFIHELHDQIGISLPRIRAFSEKSQKYSWGKNGSDLNDIVKNYKKYPLVYDSLIYDVDATFADLKRLKVEMDQKKLEHLEEIDGKKHWTVSLSEDLEKLLSEECPKICIDEEDLLDFEKIKRKAAYEIKEIFPGISEKVAVIRQILKQEHTTSLLHLEEIFNRLFELKQYLSNDVLKCNTLSYESNGVIKKAFFLIEQIELALAHQLSKEDKTSPQVLSLLSRIAIEQGFVKEEIKELSQWMAVLEKASNESFLGYKNLRQQIINNPNLLDLLEKSKMSLDSVVQMVQGSLHTGLAAALDQFINIPSQQSENISGLSTQQANVIGKVRFISTGEDFEPAREGEILIIQNASSEVHKYAKAAAIISEQGGVFSHAAITFKELGIPALLGCDIKLLKDFEGKYIHLRLAEKPFITLLPEEAIPIVENASVPTIEMALMIENLSKDVGKVVAEPFYQSVFEKLSSKEIVPFMQYNYAQDYYIKEKSKVKDLEKRLWKVESPLEKGHLLSQIEAKLNKLREVALEWNSDLAHEIENDLVEVKRRSAQMQLKKPFFGPSGKIENLERLLEFMPTIKLSHFALDVPAIYQNFKAQEFIWEKHPELKIEIQKILNSELAQAEKSQQILALISKIEINPSLLGSFEGDLIVRSSAKLEDQANSAAAGIFTSVPVKDSRDLPQAFREVLSSAFSEKALAFYSQLKLEDKEAVFDMGFIVQKYISNGEFSGVAFSVANAKNWDVAGMQLVKGLGGGVDGHQTPAQMFVDTRENTFFDLQIKPGESLPIKVEAIKEIGSLMKILENHFNAPVEIEFVITGNTLSIVQLRPINALDK